MKYFFKLGLVFVGLLVMQAAYAEDLSPAFMPEHDQGGATYLYKEDGKLRSKLTSTVERITRDGKVIYKLLQHGEGSYKKFDNITWVSEAEFAERKDRLYVLFSRRTLKDKAGNTVIQYEKIFDYDKKKSYFKTYDSSGKLTRKSTFPIKGITTDDITLIYFLKTYIAHRGDPEYESFYLVNNDGKLYRITLKDLGLEEINPPPGKYKAVKMRLIIQLGLLTAIIKAVVPPTYVWYTDGPPYGWLQYEGLEAGRGTTHVKVFVTEASSLK